MAAYPQQAIPNGFQILGQALTTGGAQIQDYADSRNKLKVAMEEMALRKAQAVIADIKEKREAKAAEDAAARLAAEETRKAAEFAEKQAQAKRSQTARDEIAAGKVVPGKAVNGVIAPDETVPYSPEEANRLLLKAGDLSAKDYAATIDPAKSIAGQKEIFGFKDAAQTARDEKRAQYAMAVEEYKQGKLDYRALMALKAQLAKTEAPKDLTAPEVDKLTSLGSKRDNIEFMVNSFDDSYSGLGNGFQNKLGEYTGTNEDQVLWWKGYQDFVNQVRNDLFGASLTPPEAAEFRKAVISPNTSPKIARAYLAKQLKIVNDAVERKRRTAKAGRKVNAAQVDAALGGEKPKKSADDYLKDAGL